MLRSGGLTPAPMKRRLASSLGALLSAAAALSACQGSEDQGPVNLSKGVPVGAVLALTGNANVYGQDLPRSLFSRMIDAPVEQALRLDATCVVVNLFRIPGQPEVTDQCIQNILRIKPECDRYAMPLMIEPLVFQPNAKAGGYMVDGDLQKILPLVRQAVELGADIIKADPTYDVSLYHRVVEISGRIPVLVRGGGRVSDAEILARTVELMKQGAKGIVYGRNVVQHARPDAITKALMAVVHDGVSADAAMAMMGA